MLSGLWLGFSVLSSPFAPHVLPPASSPSPFFEGWFTRVVSHDTDLSFSVILGAFRPPHGSAPTEVWACLLLDDKGNPTTTQGFADPALFQLTVRGQHVTQQPKLGTPASFRWVHQSSSGLNGTLVVDGDNASLDFSFPSASGFEHNFRVQAWLSHRAPWDRSAPDSGGPEGWLAGAEQLLPTHYYVQSLASSATFKLTELRADGTPIGATTSGRGFAHQEANWGGTFPEAWVWAQGMTADGQTQMVLTAGEFTVAGITTQQAIIAVRSPTKSVTLRNIDLDRIESVRRPCAGLPSLRILAESRNSSTRLTVTLEAPRNTFSLPLEAPSAEGFSARPGCVESYSAVARVEILQRRDEGEPWVSVEAFSLRQAALEFGGEYIRDCLNSTGPAASDPRDRRQRAF